MDEGILISDKERAARADALRMNAIRHHAAELTRLADVLIVSGVETDRAKQLIDEYRSTGYCRIDSQREFGETPHVKLPVLPAGDTGPDPVEEGPLSSSIGPI